MNQSQKNLQMNRTLAITLSLLVVVAVCVTAIAVGTAKKEKPPAQSSSKTSQSTSRSTQNTSQKPEPSDKPDTSVVVEKVTFVAPMTAGNVIKQWSADIPVFSTTMEDYRLHLGIDVAADAGSPVYAVADGKIESVSFHPMMGQTVVITHADGYKSVYQNMQTAVPNGIRAGAEVKAGAQIGTVGDTALIEISEDPHLHFELYKDDASVNPLAHFSVSPIDPSKNYEDK